MIPSNLSTILTVLGSVIAAFLTGGGIVAYIQSRSNKPIVDADARSKNVSAEITVGEAWQRYAAKQEEVAANLLKQHDALTAKYQEEIRLKDIIIENLKREIEVKELKIASLEAELAGRHARKEAAAEKEREVLHEHVDESIDNIKDTKPPVV